MSKSAWCSGGVGAGVEASPRQGSAGRPSSPPSPLPGSVAVLANPGPRRDTALPYWNWTAVPFQSQPIDGSTQQPDHAAPHPAPTAHATAPQIPQTRHAEEPPGVKHGTDQHCCSWASFSSSPVAGKLRIPGPLAEPSSSSRHRPPPRTAPASRPCRGDGGVSPSKTRRRLLKGNETQEGQFWAWRCRER